MSSVIGIDLGGTKIALTRFESGSWEVQEESKLETHAEKEFEHVLEDLVEAIEQIKAEDTVAVGIGVPGLVKQPEGTVLTMPNIPGAINIDLQVLLTERLGIPVKVGNDANCFALAEAHMGAGQGHAVVVGVTLGTGVGGGIVVDGQLYHGARGYASEIGHMLLKPGEVPFDLGDRSTHLTESARGDVEQHISGNALRMRCQAAKTPGELLEGETCSFMHPDVFRETAWMCVNLVHLLDPSIIVFGGSAGRALESHLEDIEKEIEQWLLPGTPVPEVAVAKLKNAATLGAALLVDGN